MDSIARQMDETDVMVLVGPLGLISIGRSGFDCATDGCGRWMGGYDGFGRATGSYFDRQDDISTGGMPYLPHACMNGGC